MCAFIIINFYYFHYLCISLFLLFPFISYNYYYYYYYYYYYWFLLLIFIKCLFCFNFPCVTFNFWQCSRYLYLAAEWVQSLLIRQGDEVLVTSLSPDKISLMFVHRFQINNIPALVMIMAWRRSGDKPLSKPMMVNLLTRICVTRPQWVNNSRLYQNQNGTDIVDIIYNNTYLRNLKYSANNHLKRISGIDVCRAWIDINVTHGPGCLLISPSAACLRQ